MHNSRPFYKTAWIIIKMTINKATGGHPDGSDLSGRTEESTDKSTAILSMLHQVAAEVHAAIVLVAAAVLAMVNYYLHLKLNVLVALVLAALLLQLLQKQYFFFLKHFKMCNFHRLLMLHTFLVLFTHAQLLPCMPRDASFFI